MFVSRRYNSRVAVESLRCNIERTGAAPVADAALSANYAPMKTGVPTSVME